MIHCIASIVASAALAAAPAAPKASASSAAGPQTDEQQALYLLGASLAQRASDFALKPGDLKWVKMGLEDFVAGRKLKVDPQAVNPKLQKLGEERTAARVGAEKKKGQAFAEQAMKQPGAKRFPDGLIYIPIQEGTGASPKVTDKVKVHYHGTFTDGRVFDSSMQRGQPAEFPLNGVIPCWTEALQQMKVGGKAKLVCPSDIAYGDQGRPGIPPGATLVFEVDLLDILK